jgi:hypothetical protein
MRFPTKLLPLAMAGALALGLAGQVEAKEPSFAPGEVTPVQGYWVDPPPRWVPAPRPRGYYYEPPRYYRPPPPRYYAPPPPAYYYAPPPRYYRPPPPPPGIGLYFRF